MEHRKLRQQYSHCGAYVVALLLLAVALLAVTGAQAAASEISIGSLRDIDFGQVTPTAGNLRVDATFCVALDERSRYQITGAGSGIAGGFTLQWLGGSSDVQIPYRVFVNDRGNRQGRELQAGVPLVGLRGKALRPGGRCPRPPARLVVRIGQQQLRAARPGPYRGTLSLTVVPE